MTQVVRLAQELVRFDTVNPPGNEEPAMLHLGAFLQERGIGVAYQRLSADRVNLMARIQGRSELGHLVLSGHMDVVHPGAAAWNQGPFEGEIVEGRLVGRGSADMKGGVSAMAVALADLAADGFRPRADLILAVTAGEEVDTAGAKLLASTNVLAGSQAILVGEPTGLDVFVAEKGVLWLRITAHGRTAHGSMPELGVNAVAYMARVLCRLENEVLPFPEHTILGKPSVSVNRINGGVKVNVVPDRCEAEVDIRLVPGQTQDEALEHLKLILQETAREIPVRTDVEILQSMPAVETPTDADLVRATVEAAAGVRGKEPAIGGVSYGTDGAVLAPALRASLVIFGPGSPAQAHQPNEYVETSQLEQAVDVYTMVAKRMLGP